MAFAASRRIVNSMFCSLLRPAMELLFNYSFDSLRHLPPSYLLLCNHTTDYDPIFLSLAAGAPVRFVASEHIMRKGFGSWFLRRFFDPIIHTKGAIGLKTTTAILRTLRGGQSVALFPEGNRSFNGLTGYISPSAGKLARSSGVGLVTYRLEGGYLSQPRWGGSRRRGRLRGHLVGVYSSDELKAMTSDEVLSLIRRDLAEDAYAAQERERVAYHGKNAVRGLESLLFYCPGCHALGTLTSSGDALTCSCGYRASLDQYGYLTEGSRKVTITERDLSQRDALSRIVQSGEKGSVLFSDRIVAHRIGSDHSAEQDIAGEIAAYPDGFSFSGRRIPPDEILGAAIHSRNTLTVHLGSESTQYEITGAPYWNALKYLYLYRLLKETELF